MTVHLHSRRETTPDVVAKGARRSITRVVLSSLAVGLLGALTLALVVFPGAPEAVITGALLIGFGAGWTVLALVSGRRTDRPQRWAHVPALVMTVTGAALVVFRPHETALSALTWLWAPLVLVLVAWTAVRARRGLPPRARLLVAPVLLTLVVISAGALVEGSGLARDDHPAPGRVLAVRGHQLHLDCRGTGTPTVVLSNGMGELSASWARIVDEMSTRTRVCAYDRVGQGWSEAVDAPQDGVQAAADLHALLAEAGERGPFVLVGHSVGGPYAMTYAAQYPDDVAGMVLLDSTSPRQFSDLPDYPLQYALMRRGLSLEPTLARVGLGPATSPRSHLPGEEGALVDAMGSTVGAKSNVRDELATLPRLLEQARSLTTLGDRPLEVLTASENLSTRGWSAAQEQLAALSSDTLHRVVHSSHAGLLEDAGGASASVEAIAAVTRSVQTGAPLSTP